MHLTLVKRDEGWVLFEGNADDRDLDGPWDRKRDAVESSKELVDNGHYEQLRIYTASGKLDRLYDGADAGSRRDGARRGDAIRDVSQLNSGDRLTPKPGSKVRGRSLYGSKWVVDEVRRGEAVLQRLSNGRRRDEYMSIDSTELGQFDIFTTEQRRSAWSNYSKEGGHRIM